MCIMISSTLQGNFKKKEKKKMKTKVGMAKINIRVDLLSKFIKFCLTLFMQALGNQPTRLSCSPFILKERQYLSAHTEYKWQH